MKQLERELIEQAAKGESAALVHVQKHLQCMTIEWGVDHARIEAQQFVIYSISVCNREEQEAFRMLLDEMIEQTPKNLEYKGFTGPIQYDRELKTYDGLVEAIEPDLVAYIGDSLDELEASFRNGIDLYLEGKHEAH